MSSQLPISAGQVVALARDAMKAALEEQQRSVTESNGVSDELKPGVTIDLSHKNIQRFPEEVVDIIKNELERYVIIRELTGIFFLAFYNDPMQVAKSLYRLALSHNQISTFPIKFSECIHLRYLNVRNNFIKEFPLSVRDASIECTSSIVLTRRP
jgi:hypothetical protein